ncbi:uncharacterized protein LOC121856379 isoform X1 [Homarus americanus]|uniref:uncharacterized protein LOC121856379 isoform X1 n=1 Tax=Homarus americanus TaxID=6706 RepID=UPI001C43B922|nr:uncharacterized protein LOC121856379 isoform X1 [Homarus americanus]XP_042207847.1 uncharacterized protein LOC121856379 isoform X1 [Homarus americanus]
MKWVWLVTLVVVTEATTDDQSTPGIDQLNEILNNTTTTLCQYIKCQEPVKAADCPIGTFYQQRVAQFGCCGACVRFKQKNDTECTGSIDPKFGGGYSSMTPDLLDPEASSDPVNNTLVSSWCDFFLNCTEEGVCQPDNSDHGCRYVQDQYDSDLDEFPFYKVDFRWRPSCTPEGLYTEKQCKGPYSNKRCVCVDAYGTSIYGKAFSWQRDLYDNMNCMCSRRVWELQQEGVTSVTLHCQENGNYEPLQCEDDWCYCMDPDTALPYGSSFPDAMKEHLPCYNKTVTGEQYLRRCESQYHAEHLLATHIQRKGVYPPSTLLNCDDDGSFGGLQHDLDGLARCYDQYDEMIAQPAVRDCNCARDKILFTEAHLFTTLKCATPDQAVAGQYYEIQVFGGTAYCVDPDGVRAGPMVYSQYRDKLNCTAGMSCQNGNRSDCNKTCHECSDDMYVGYTPTLPQSA